MTMSILTAVILILGLIALYLAILWISSILTGNSMNTVCKEAAGRMLTIPLIGYKPLQPLCDIIAPAGAGNIRRV